MFKNGDWLDALGNDIVLPRHLKWSDFVQSKEQRQQIICSIIQKHGVVDAWRSAFADSVPFKIAFQTIQNNSTVVCSFGGWAVHLAEGQSIQTRPGAGV